MALTDNVVAYWKLDESSGNAADSTGNGYTLTNNNTVGYVPAKINNGADFGASNTNKTLSRTDSLGITNGSVSLSMWLWVDTQPASGESQTHAIVSASRYYIIRYRNVAGTRSLYFAGAGSSESGISITGDLALDTWYHAVITYDSGTGLITAYLNGVRVGTATNSTTGTFTPRTVIGGATTSVELWKGLVDEVGVWSRALTYTEVSQLWNSGNAVQYNFSTLPTDIFIDEVSGFTAATNTSVSQSHTVGAGNNRMLFAYVGASSSGVAPTATYAGNPMQLISSQLVSSPFSIYLFALINPPTGTANITANFGSSIFMRVGGASYVNVKQSYTPDSSATNSSGSTSSPSVSTTVVASNCWLVGIITGGNTLSAFNRAVRVSQFDTAISDSNGVVTAGSQTFSCTQSPASFYGAVLTSWAPAGSGPANVKTWDGITQSTGIKQYFGVDLANVKTVNGIS